METYIIGNGLFGQVAKDLLAIYGVKAKTIDCMKEHSGTSASGNITKPSWVSGLGEASQIAYEDLDNVYGLKKFSPVVALGKSIDLFYVSRSHTLKMPDIVDEVLSVGDGVVTARQNGSFEGNILVAAGVWSGNLISMPKIENIVGASCLFMGNFPPNFVLRSPYKQSISYSDDNNVTWFGDGTAIKFKNWDDKRRVAETLDRAKQLGLTFPYKINVGFRPYVEGHKNGYYARVSNRTWVSTGGGKNGIVLAAIQARKFLEEIA